MANPVTQQPPHPEGKTCETCAMWQRTHQQDYVLQPQGLVPKATWMAAGNPIIGVTIWRCAFCWLLPTWTLMKADQYCAQHEDYRPADAPDVPSGIAYTPPPKTLQVPESEEKPGGDQ